MSLGSTLTTDSTRAQKSSPPKMLARPLAGAPLTPKEREVYRLAVLGMTNKEVAESMSLTEGTAKIYRSRVMAKIGGTQMTWIVREMRQRIFLLHLGVSRLVAKHHDEIPAHVRAEFAALLQELLQELPPGEKRPEKWLD